MSCVGPDDESVGYVASPGRVSRFGREVLWRGNSLPEVALSYRISSVPGKSETTVLVEGRLSAAGARDLESEVQRAPGPVLLDVAGLRSASAHGARTLRSFADRGGKIVGASPYILLLMARASETGEEG